MSSKWLFLVIYLAGLPILLLSPYFLFIAAMILLVVVWIYTNITTQGNPHRRMAMESFRHPIDGGRFERYSSEIEKGDETDYDFINFFGFVGFAWIITSLASFVFFP